MIKFIRALLQSNANEWRMLHASLQLIHRKLETMSEELDRLTASVGHIGEAVARIAVDIKNHSAATADGGKLSALADQLDAAAASLTGLATGMETPAPAPTPDPVPTPTPPATDPTV